MYKKNKLILKSILVLTFLFALSLAVSHDKTQSAPSTNVKDQLSSAQLSYFARLGASNSTGDSTVRVSVGTTANPNNNTTNLFPDDVVGIGRSGANGLDSYTVRDIANTGSFQVTTGLAALNAATGNIVVATRSAIHTVHFTPKSSITAGAWQFLIKATSRTGEKQNDGMPDQQGFDLGADVGATTTGLGTRLKDADISCPFGTASVGSTTSIGTDYYHIITCDLGVGETNPIDVGATITIGRALATGSQLINPSAALGHTPGTANSTADVYKFFVRHLDASSILIDADTTAGRIAVVDAVRVTATIDPTITFIIDSTNVGTGGTPCGHAGFGSNAANTTATAVSFGSLSLGAFNDLGHRLSCVTNADSGYAVTVFESDAMTNVNTGTTIADTNCDGSCSVTTEADWATDTTHSEWGYSIQNVNVGTSIFHYTDGWKAFGQGASNAQEIMKNTSTPTATEYAYMCYRVTASTTQEAGNYETHLVYTATATF